MPDFENVIDELRVYLSQKRGLPDSTNYWRGFAAGKTAARKQIAILVAVIVAAMTLWVTV